MSQDAASASLPRWRHVTKIAKTFLAWKLLLLIVVAFAPGPAYDTSTELALPSPAALSKTDAVLSHILIRLTRWDSIYFVNIARRGYLYEQEWAFGQGFMFLTSQLARVLPPTVLPDSLLHEALAGALIAHAAHFLAAIMLYLLTLRTAHVSFERKRSVAITAAYLHIFSQAGVFLSAPYTESLFALLNFLGFYALTFVKTAPGSSSSRRSLNLLCPMLAGCLFGTSCTVRGNGIFSITAFVVLGLVAITDLLSAPLSLDNLLTTTGTAVGAFITFSGFILPQIQGYNEYCRPATRPWCTNTVPSIYTFVQSHYWGNGFLRYWTLSNLPLFLIALPTLAVMLITSTACLSRIIHRSISATAPTTLTLKGWTINYPSLHLCIMAAPQLLLTLLAATSFHVQIVNRISSGYPLWYIILAMLFSETTGRLLEGDRKPAEAGEAVLPSTVLQGLRGITALIEPESLVRLMLMYALVQAGLYASFLPPA